MTEPRTAASRPIRQSLGIQRDSVQVTVRKSLGVIARHPRGWTVLADRQLLTDLCRVLRGQADARAELYAWAASVRAWSDPQWREIVNEFPQPELGAHISERERR